MSLLGGGLTGDIWSTGAFSFESPLKDLLDSGDFTIEQLLAEDELLQEMRGVHPKLISYFSTEEAVTKLVQYLILPPESSDADADADADSEADAPSSGKHSVTDSGSATPTDSAEPETETGETTAETAAAADGTETADSSEQPKVPHKTRQPGEWITQQLESKAVGVEATDSTTKSKTPQDDPEMLHIRFPFMACEIMCCEISGVLSALVDGNVVLPKANGNGKEPSLVEQRDIGNIFATTNSNDTGDMRSGLEVVDPVPLRILDLFFSVLYQTAPGKLDDYRAGYFDKILSVLFRKRPLEMSAYINSGGCHGRPALMRAILNHLYSHSIMQIAQRLLLPLRPVAASSQQQDVNPDDELLADALCDPNVNGNSDDGPKFECDWSGAPQALEILLDILMGTDATQTDGNGDSDNSESNSDTEYSYSKGLLEERRLNLSQNASEVLITIIQHSLLSSATMLTLTSTENLGKIVTAATVLSETAINARMQNDSPYFSPHESLLTSAMNVLESLILQLGGYGAVGTMSVLPEDEEEEEEPGSYDRGNNVPLLTSSQSPLDSAQETSITIMESSEQANEENVEVQENKGQELLIAELTTMLEHLPRLLDNLAKLLRHPSTMTMQWKSPMQFCRGEPQQLLGTSRLRIVRVLEAMVLLGDPDVDSFLVQSDCLEICLDLFWEFQWCSMLHQSVANLLVHVFEGGNARVDMQEYFIIRCNLLSRLMDSYLDVQVTPNISIPEVVMSGMKEVHIIGSGSGGDRASTDRLAVSEDDVDAALEQESEARGEDTSVEKEAPATEAAEVTPVDVDQEGSTGGVQIDESRDGSTSSEVIGAPASQSFRLGYMGHVIIICQALVHASTDDANSDDMDENPNMEGSEAQKPMDGESVSVGPDDGTNGESERQELPEPLLLAEMVKYHPAVERWHEFMSTTLASETSIQATPLGGFNASASGDPMHSHRPGLAEGDMMDDDGGTPSLPPRGMLGGGDVIDMDDGDLDIAASMIAGMTLGRQNSGGSGDSDSDGGNSGDSQRTYDSGETANTAGYLFDDPLGKMKDEGLGIELGKLTQYKSSATKRAGNARNEIDDDEDEENDSSSDEEPEIQRCNSDDEDVPVMDLFAGNFSYGEGDQSAEGAPPDWSNFANFDDAFVPGESNKDDEFGPFSSAENPALATVGDLSEGSAVSDAEIEEIFGKGDHSTLLEAEDPAAESELFFFPTPSGESEPFESAATTEDEAPTAPLAEGAAAATDAQPATIGETATEIAEVATEIAEVATSLAELAATTTAVEETSQPETDATEDSSPVVEQSDDNNEESTPVKVVENEIKEPLHAPENGAGEEPATD